MRHWIIRILGTVLLALATSEAVAAETEPPETVVFVVGLESYRDPELNKLQYPAQDARELFRQIDAVTNLQKSRSWLLLAERTAEDREVVDNQARIKLRRYWTASDIRSELRIFLRGVKSHDNVIIYLGGHGTAARNESLLLIGSDYDPDKANDLPYADLIGDIQREIQGRSLAQVKIAMFLNVCGAGNALALSVTPEVEEAARKLNDQLQFGKFGFALFPAAARNADAFEDREERKHSVFAYSLIQGLSGTAAEKQTGVITASGLFRHLQNGINEFRKEKGQAPVTLPRNDQQFDGDMVIGVTKRKQGEANYLVGMSLLAAAQETVPGSDDRAGRDERVAQGMLLRDLAADQFGQALQRNPELTSRARLRRVQANLWNGHRYASEEVQKDLRALKEGLLDSYSSAEREGIAKIISAQEAGGGPTLHSLRDQLQAGAPFHSVLIGDKKKSSENSLAKWGELFSHYPGQLMTLTGTVKPNFLGLINFGPAEKSQLPDELIDQIRKLNRPAGGDQPRLFVVYGGSSITPAAATSGTGLSGALWSLLGLGNETHRDRLFPFGRLEIEQIARAWSGPLTVIVDASFGGALLQGEAVDADEVSLLLAAREPNGLVFEERQGLADSQANLVASPLMEVFEQGIDDPPTDPTIIAARERYQKLFSGNSSWVVGTPIWIPRWTRSGASTARMQLEPLSRWASLVAHSCAQRALDECEGLVSGSVGPEARDAFVLLSSVAGADLSGAVGKSIRKYQAAADSLSRLATASNSDFPGTTDARAALERAASAVRLRAESAASSDGRRVHILSFAVEDYQSPLIARLPGTTRDLDAYAQAIKAVLSVPATEVVVDRKIASTAKEVLDALRTARKEVENRPQDLIIVIFSGRGIELNGRRYLAPASVVPNISESPAQLADAQAPVIAWDTDELIDIWQIADIMQGRWFLGIYDVQFTSPVLEARADQLLDKHLDSVRPQVQGASSLGADANRMKGNQGGASVMLRRGDVPARQVHIWVDGRLTPAVKPPHPCIKDPQSIAVSPLATAIALSLHSGHPGTYRNWMTALAQEECLHATKGDLTLTFQGDLDVPAFGSGEGAQFVEYFRNGDIRRETNLRAAAGVANDAMHRFPIVRHKLARAALLVSLIELFNDRQEILQMTEEQEKWTQEARSLLESLTFEQMGSEDSAALWPMRIELLVRLYQLRHDPGAALRVLQEAAPVEVLLDRGLTRRLVDATQAAINQQSTSVFESSATILLTLQKAQTNPASQTEVDAATRGLNVLKNAERERRSEPFSLKPPTVPTSDSGALPSEKGASP